jgi:hypothetical protein
MTRVITGGPGFPNADRGNEGMDLRDWFAGQALGGVIVQCASDHDTNRYSGGPATYFAMKAYELADAMLSEKAKAEAANRAADKEEYGDDLPF